MRLSESQRRCQRPDSPVTPEQVDFFLHPQFDAAATASGNLLTRGLNVSPGAAVGHVAFDADMAEAWAKNEGKQVIMVRPETKPDDVHGMLAAEGILTSRGGRTSHAALVARQFGTPAVVGVSSLDIDLANRRMKVGSQEIKEGDWISIDGTTGRIWCRSVDARQHQGCGIGNCDVTAVAVDEDGSIRCGRIEVVTSGEPMFGERLVIEPKGNKRRVVWESCRSLPDGVLQHCDARDVLQRDPEE